MKEAKKINYPPILSEDGLMDEENKGIYVYAAFLKPGLHKFVIFDPVNQRAFCKEIVIDLNNNYVECPEIPEDA